MNKKLIVRDYQNSLSNMYHLQASHETKEKQNDPKA